MTARTFIVVPASDVPVALSDFRRRHIHHPGATVPFHTTVIAPFLPPGELDNGGLDRLRDLALNHPAFDYVGGSVCAFPTSQTLWLAPSPVGPFERLNAGIHGLFPELISVPGQPTYHLTLAEARSDDELARSTDEFIAEFSGTLPWSLRATEMVIYVGEDGRYRPLHTIALGGS
jgi:hypothetical protein